MKTNSDLLFKNSQILVILAMGESVWNPQSSLYWDVVSRL